ncbi:MAG TPA: bifunctional methylenetetrahydrofolate dehydrogenase/methenyltetrahydrofolate cyclohydrolase FolD [Caulobacteraceae bacterium]|nr:bifunctional methylenetetrahydrofolate dehydrogenase/methenyltetrahydrofolate cyclohydrolase FolD [Caulobacteraceae bacterium]
MTAQIIDGRVLAETVRARVTAEVARLAREHGLKPGLAVVLVGDDPASQIYVRSKGEQSLAAGMHSVTHRLPAETSEGALISLVSELNADPAIHGILVQLPLPAHIDESHVLAVLNPAKDVDGLTVTSAGRRVSGLPALTSCTPVGCMIMLRETLGDLAGKRALVVGRSLLVGRPLADLLLAANCTVTIAHSKTVDLPDRCREAEILCAAIGRPQMIKGEWIRPGAAVIDVGVNRVPFRDPVAAAAGKTKVVGDVDFKSASKVAGWITPVPGGVGLMTVACLLDNTVTAAKRIAGLAA